MNGLVLSVLEYCFFDSRWMFMNVLTNPNQAGIRSILRSINANLGQRLAQPIVQADRKTISCRLSVFFSTERHCVGEAASRDRNGRHGTFAFARGRLGTSDWPRSHGGLPRHVGIDEADVRTRRMGHRSAESVIRLS